MLKSDASRLRRAGLTAPFLVTVGALWVKSVAVTALLREAPLVGSGSLVGWIAAHPLLVATSLAAALLLAPLLLLPDTTQVVALLVANLILTLLLLANFVHMRFYGVMLSLHRDLDPEMLPFVARSAAMLLSPWHALFFVDLIAIGVFFLTDEQGRARLLSPRSPIRLRARTLAALGLLVAGLVLAVPAIRLFANDRAELEFLDLQQDLVEKVGILPYHAGEILTGDFGDRPGDAFSVSEIEGFLDDQRGSAVTSARRRMELYEVARGRNLILISGESWMEFTLGLEIAGQPVTPHLTRFAAESVRWDHFYDQTHLGTTADADFMANQSLHPTSGTPVATRFHDNRFHGLPAVLSSTGYSTLAACAAPGWFWRMSTMHRSLGYQRGYYREDFTETEIINDWLADEEFFAQMLPILREQPEPFQAFLLSSSNHLPYEIPVRHRHLDLAELEGTRLGDYLHSVHYWDRAFGSFVEGLQQAGLLDRSVVAVYGDHEGWLRRPPELARLLGFPESSQLDHLLMEVAVPFLVRLPQAKAAGVRSNSGGHVDIAPTLLSLLGVPWNDAVFMGSDLTTGNDSLVVLRDGSFVLGNRFLHNRLGPIERSQCFDIETRTPIDCGSMAEARRAAVRRLRMSDAILRRDLIPELRASSSSDVTADRLSPGAAADGPWPRWQPRADGKLPPRR